MKERLEALKQYANANDNWWLSSKLDLLETEIRIAILDAKTEVYKEIIKQRDEQ